MKLLYVITFLVLISLFTNACTQKTIVSPTPIEPDSTSTISIKITNFFGSEELILGNEYTNLHNEMLKPEILKYYLSNFSFQKTDGSIVTIPQDSSYFLVDQENNSSRVIVFNNVRIGEYSSIKFLVGVDSLRSVSGIESRKGVLDVGGLGKDMYWGWNSGYVFFMFEGTSPSSTVFLNRIRYHVGGFGGYSSPSMNNLRNIIISHSSPIKLIANKKTYIDIKAQISTIYIGSQDVSIETYPSIMFVPISSSIATNYSRMFSVESVINE